MPKLTAILLAAIVAGMSCRVFAQDDGGVELPLVLDLQTAQRIALRDNPSLKVAEQRVVQASARVTQARSAYFPTIDSTLSSSVTNLSSNTLAQNPLITDRTQENYQASINATWLVFDGLGRKFRTASARFGLKRTEAALQEAQRLLLSAVATAFYNVQLARENISIARADEAFNQRQLEDAQARRRAGSGSLSDELNFQVRVKNAQSAVVQAERSQAVASIILLELMAIPGDRMPESIEVSPLMPEEPWEIQSVALPGLVEYARTHRPDVLESYYFQEQAKASVREQRADFYPSVGAFASGDATRTEDPRFESDDVSSTVGVSLSYDIFTGGRRRAELKEAQALRTEARRQAESTVLAIESDVREARETLLAAQRELSLQRETTDYVEQNRELVEREYRAGQGSLVRLNEAQRDLIAQQSRLALSRVALRQAWHDLRSATAETLAPYYAE